MKLIDKSAVKAELEKRIEETKGMRPKFDQFWAGQISAFKGVLNILNTLEVKEVDLIKIKGYVARDKDGSIWFHYTKPHRENDIEKTWWGSNDKSFEIYDFDFPEYADLTWEESEPVEVELTLKRLNAGG